MQSHIKWNNFLTHMQTTTRPEIVHPTELISHHEYSIWLALNYIRFPIMHYIHTYLAELVQCEGVSWHRPRMTAKNEKKNKDEKTSTECVFRVAFIWSFECE